MQGTNSSWLTLVLLEVKVMEGYLKALSLEKHFLIVRYFMTIILILLLVYFSHIKVSHFIDQVNLPEPKQLPADINGERMPHVIVADEAFPLKPFLLRPFPGKQLNTENRKIYNYRLSRARRVVENTFGMCLHIM